MNAIKWNVRLFSVDDIFKYFHLNVNAQPVWILVRDNKRHGSLQANNKDCSKGEGPIRSKDPREKEGYNGRGSARARAYQRQQRALESSEQWQVRLQQRRETDWRWKAMNAEEKRQVRRVQPRVNLERQDAEWREARLDQWGCIPGGQGIWEWWTKGG